MKKIPSKITLGGQDVEIKNVERCNNNAVGECHLLEGYIEIADIFNKDQKQQSQYLLPRIDTLHLTNDGRKRTEQ